MKKGFASLYLSNDWGLGAPFIYTGSQWKTVRPYVYTNGAWEPIGGAGTNMVYFLVSNGDYLVDSDNKYVLVRQG